MGLFGGTRGKGFDELVQEARGADTVIVDVRDEGEFARGHVPGAQNVPLGRIEELARTAGEGRAALRVLRERGAERDGQPKAARGWV